MGWHKSPPPVLQCHKHTIKHVLVSRIKNWKREFVTAEGGWSRGLERVAGGYYSDGILFDREQQTGRRIRTAGEQVGSP